jgi:hypothetical protein
VINTLVYIHENLEELSVEQLTEQTCLYRQEGELKEEYFNKSVEIARSHIVSEDN